jgi:2-polyprenyl-6-methoxyphenol hydroxylase-like FAD-dependent oxidoreductase
MSDLDLVELLIIGGGPTGLAAARAYRDLGREGNVAIVVDENRMPYERPALTKGLLRGEIGFDQLAIEDAAGVDAEWDSVPGFWSTIGTRTLKYTAWGDGYDETHLDRAADGGFTAWYGADGKVVGVLTHDADEDYERGARQITQGARWPW